MNYKKIASWATFYLGLVFLLFWLYLTLSDYYNYGKCDFDGFMDRLVFTTFSILFLAGIFLYIKGEIIGLVYSMALFIIISYMIILNSDFFGNTFMGASCF